MEPIGAFPDGEWESFSKMFSADDQPDFIPQFLGQCSFLLEHDGGLISRGPSSTFGPTSDQANLGMTGVKESLLYSLDNLNSNLQHISPESSNSSNCRSSIFIATPGHDNYYFGDVNHIPVDNDMCMSMNICLMDEKNTGSFFPAFPDVVMGDTVYTNEDAIRNGSVKLDDGQPAAIAIPGKELLLKRKLEMPESHIKAEDKLNGQSSESAKKKPRVSRDARKIKKNVQSKKNQKLPNSNREEESNVGRDGQSSSSYSSDDDNASEETNGGASNSEPKSTALNLSGKMRASRGSATDPQSLYARKRRERINERLRILQNLVPNGTKVDISTMLEEAVRYVKFLQLQIKLLSSDDMWMYAPIAYNGMDIGLINRKISPPL